MGRRRRDSVARATADAFDGLVFPEGTEGNTAVTDYVAPRTGELMAELPTQEEMLPGLRAPVAGQSPRDWGESEAPPPPPQVFEPGIPPPVDTSDVSSRNDIGRAVAEVQAQRPDTYTAQTGPTTLVDAQTGETTDLTGQPLPTRAEYPTARLWNPPEMRAPADAELGDALADLEARRAAWRKTPAGRENTAASAAFRARTKELQAALDKGWADVPKIAAELEQYDIDALAKLKPTLTPQGEATLLPHEAGALMRAIEAQDHTLFVIAGGKTHLSLDELNSIWQSRVVGPRWDKFVKSIDEPKLPPNVYAEVFNALTKVGKGFKEATAAAHAAARKAEGLPPEPEEPKGENKPPIDLREKLKRPIAIAKAGMPPSYVKAFDEVIEAGGSLNTAMARGAAAMVRESLASGTSAAAPRAVSVRARQKLAELERTIALTEKLRKETETTGTEHFVEAAKAFGAQLSLATDPALTEADRAKAKAVLADAAKRWGVNVKDLDKPNKLAAAATRKEEDVDVDPIIEAAKVAGVTTTAGLGQWLHDNYPDLGKMRKAERTKVITRIREALRIPKGE